MASTLLSDNLGIAWIGDFESLRQFVSEHLKIDGVWSHPGGDKKVFTSENVIISWRKSKGILLVSGDKAGYIVNELCKQICNGGDGIRTQTLPSNKSADIYHDIEDLKCGLSANGEAIQSLSDSVCHISSVLSQLQDFVNTRKKAVFGESTVTSPANEYAKQAQIYDAEAINTTYVPDQSINTTVNNWNEELPKNGPLADERAIELQNMGEMSEPTTYAEVVASQLVPTAAPEMTKHPVPNSSGGLTKAVELPANKPVVIDDGFIGVERKRNRIKQLFLTGIAKNVKENQIQSYLEDRDVTPTRITIFQSKRKGTISAKVNIPSVSLPLVQHEHFWPKFVTCKLWRSNLNGKKADPKPRMTRSAWELFNICLMAAIPVRITTRNRQLGLRHHQAIRPRVLTDVNINKSGPPRRRIVPTGLVLNARSLVKPDASAALHLELRNNNVDLCIITETWLKPAIPSHLVCPNEFSMIHKDRENRQGGGVAVICRNDWKLEWLSKSS